MKTRRSGFTMIEILMAIVIIAILAAMLMIGYKRLSAGTANRSTRMTLDNAKAMLAEYERKNKLTAYAGTMPAPGNVNEDYSAGDRNGAQVMFTRSFFSTLTAIPENKAAFAAIDSAQIFQGTDDVPPAAGWADGTGYVPFVIVRYPAASNNFFISLTVHTSDVATNNPSITGSPWLRVNTKTPILLDAWRNPIIFVPAGGLADVWTQDTLATPAPIKAPNNRPFFASAGPDGIFGRMPGPDGVFGRTAGPDGTLGTPDDVGDDIYGGDDNLYSFEN